MDDRWLSCRLGGRYSNLDYNLYFPPSTIYSHLIYGGSQAIRSRVFGRWCRSPMKDPQPAARRSLMNETALGISLKPAALGQETGRTPCKQDNGLYMYYLGRFSGFLRALDTDPFHFCLHG